jgi:enoyl-CoA hydratase/carnithine racemase
LWLRGFGKAVFDVPDFVTLEVADGIGTIRLDRPPVNALSDALVASLAAAAVAAEADPEVRAVIIYGGSKVFAAGADIKEMASAGYVEMSTRVGGLQSTLDKIAAIGKPVVAAITGYALGGGLELALAADFRVAGEGARVGQPEILLGVIPGAGGTQRLPRLIGPSRAKDLVFSGRMVDAAEALSMGLVDRVVPDADVYSASMELVASYATGPAVALRAAKQAIDHGLDVDLATGLALERVHFAALFGTEDQREGMRSFIAKGPGKAKFKGQLSERHRYAPPFTASPPCHPRPPAPCYPPPPPRALLLRPRATRLRLPARHVSITQSSPLDS